MDLTTPYQGAFQWCQYFCYQTNIHDFFLDKFKFPLEEHCTCVIGTVAAFFIENFLLSYAFLASHSIHFPHV